MTHSNGRNGKRYNRASMQDPRGTWATGVPASGGFYPQRGISFSGTDDPLGCPPHAGCASSDEAGRTFAAIFAAVGECTPHAPCASTDESGRSFARTSRSKRSRRSGAASKRGRGRSSRRASRGMGSKPNPQGDVEVVCDENGENCMLIRTTPDEPL